ncbi:MAG TPA: hypothetical protein VG269_06180 [Tepidisphaeraceae bacterium]|jgi:hypothetical protein|nr:hypothetical protein [Tepidisphaeraceae bacterium]
MAAKSKSGSSTSTHGHSSHFTTDHEQIRKWAEERHAKPACVKGTRNPDGTCLVRLDFPGYSGADSLEEISWDEFFGVFDQNDLALVYQDETAEGKKSNFNKLVSRETAEEKDEKTSSKSGARHGRGH